MAEGQASEFDYTFATNDNDNVTVHLTHAIAHTTATTTRTINYAFADGDATKAPTAAIQTITWNVVTDEVTGASYATPTGEYAQVDSPVVTGYTADRNVNAEALAPTTTARLANTSKTVTYHANAANLTVTYVDDVTGQTVTTHTLTGTTDATGTYTVAAPAHYVLADGQSRGINYTFAADNSDAVTVHLTHAVEHSTATTTRTINFVVDDGDTTKAPRPVVQTVTWNVATDAVTGASVATATGTYAGVDAPTVAGYTADGNVAAQTLGAVDTADLADSQVTVHYTANDAELTVTYVDDVTGDTVTTAKLTGKTDGMGTYAVTTPAHYALADGQSGSVNYTFAADDSDNVTVHLTHAVGHSTATTTRTVNYVVTGKAELNPQSVTQSLTWNVATDEVTGTITATPQGEYAGVTSPTVNGYTADGDVSAVRATATTGMPGDAADVTVTYAANPATLTVRYVDDVTGEQVTSATLTGVTDGTGTYNVQAPTHYSLADGQSAQVSYTFAANATDDMTVHLTHAVNHTTATTTRTVNYVVDGGDVTKAPASVVQTVTWNVATDAVTGASVATPTNGYAALTSPAVAGYTASGDVAAMALGAVEATQLADSTTTVHYTADAATLTVTYVDDVTGNTVTTAVLKGTTDGTGTYNVTVPARYALADGQSSSVNYAFSADDSDNVTVHLTHAVGHSTATTTRTINYVVSGDTAKAPASVVQTVTWNVTTDAVTGASYATAQEAYGAVSAPAVAGYTADHGTDAQVMGPVAVEALADTTTTVTYTPNDADITVTYVDDTDGTTVESQTLIRQVDGTGTYTVTVPDGYQLADGQSRSINYVFATDASDNMTVHLAHHVTAGTATTTRTINYVVDGGGTTGPTSVIQTVVFATSTDDVTGLTTATAAGNYAAVATPTVAGYTADTARVTAATPQYADGDAVVTVHYAANAEQLTVRYVDDVTGTTLSTDTITGTMNQSGVYTVTVPDNYALADGQSRAVNYRLTDDDSDDVTVHLTHAMQYGDATTTRTINYVTADGKAGVAPASVTQVAHWRVVTDLATGGSIATATDGYAAVASPTLAGYTTSGNVAAVELGATNTAALQDTSVTVTYTAVAQPDNGGVTTPPATTPDNGGTTTPPATTPDNGGTPTAPVTAPVTTPSGTTTTTATVPVVPNVVATPTTPAVTPTTTTPVAPAVQAGSSTPATPLVATNTATPISAAGVTPDVASMAANIEREAAATSVASTADAAERDVTANVGADITDALNANSTDAVAQRAVTPAGVTATILNVGEQSQNRIPGGSSESTYTYFAQKIADAQTQEAVQYELLLRQWDSGVNNWVLPSSFGITVGMQTTLMQQALRSLDSGNISINLTTSQFTDDTVVQRLSSFARNQQGQGTLTIELAELPSAAQLASVMPTYHDGGVKVVLGDAQDADSSDAARVASQLDGFKFALQKLRARGEDQQWVSAAHQWQALARDTGGTFTLEGVESDGDLQVARQMGITNVQGFLFGKPAQPTQIDFE